MTNNNFARILSEKGFSLTELIVVVSIVAILAGLSVPNLLTWRRSLLCRQAAMSVVATLRLAKSQAIATNLEQKVRVGSLNRWAIQVGNKPYSSTTWSAQPWTNAPNSVTVTPAQDIQFTPNGAASVPGSTINLIDQTNVTRFQVDVEATGRIRVTKVP